VSPLRTLLLALGALLAAATPAAAAVPGENGRIAFERGFNVWTMNPDGSDQTQVTTSGATFGPAVSPDGRQIAFHRAGDIWVIDADGENERNVTAALGTTDAEATWSPDGTQLAFSSGGSGEPFRIWRIDVDGTDPVRLTNTSSGDFNPAWSPGGREIAYSRIGGSNDIYTVDPLVPGSETFYAGTDRTEDHPTWAPDGSAIAFVTNRSDGNGNEIYKQVGPGGGGVPVTSNPADDNSPAWSPDGTRIAFTSTRSGSSQIWSVGANGVEDTPVNVSQSQSVDGQPDWAVSVAPPPPEIGESVNASAARGTVRAKVPGGRFVALDDATQLPIGTTFDARKGAVRLTSAASRSGDETQTGTFSGGQFITRQSKRNPLTEMRLAGQLACKSGRGASAAGRGKRSRRLFANARGRFRTRGRNSTATVRGTQWITKDTCKGTLTTVRKGTVLVRDLRKRRNVTLKKGQRYLARAPKRRG
jgi:Tol biopolymer transport system component